MKKVSYILWTLLLAALLSGCNKWLDIEPENQANDNKVFKDYVGFRNALNGIYEMLSQQELYGREMTWGFVSALAQTYDDTDLQKSYPGLETYNYGMEKNKSVISTIWSKSYNAIANCNKLIAEIEPKDSTFFPNGRIEKNMILGEALALRGFLHFDMLRLFAPAPSTGDDGAYIPYFKVYPSKYEEKKKTSEILALAEADLKQAQHLVAELDTLKNALAMRGTVRFSLSTSASIVDRFFGYRGCRMNYLAVTGVLARLYMYGGKTTDAIREASIVYRFATQKSVVAFTASWYFFAPYTYTKSWDDILFAFHDPELIDKVAKFRLGVGPKMLLKGVDAMYDDRQDGDDYRKGLIVSGDGGQISQKWLDVGVIADYARQYPLIPVIRLSEMCYILSEAYLENNDKTNAISMLNYVRGKRGAKRQIAADVNEENSEAFKARIRTDLMWEGMKEYLTEGQTFFMFKRMNSPILNGAQVIEMGGKFVLPLPENENIH